MREPEKLVNGELAATFGVDRGNRVPPISSHDVVSQMIEDDCSSVGHIVPLAEEKLRIWNFRYRVWASKFCRFGASPGILCRVGDRCKE